MKTITRRIDELAISGELAKLPMPVQELISDVHDFIAATIKTFNTVEDFDEWLSNQITKRENAKEPNTTSNTSTETN